MTVAGIDAGLQVKTKKCRPNCLTRSFMKHLQAEALAKGPQACNHYQKPIPDKLPFNLSGMACWVPFVCQHVGVGWCWRTNASKVRWRMPNELCPGHLGRRTCASWCLTDWKMPETKPNPRCSWKPPMVGDGIENFPILGWGRVVASVWSSEGDKREGNHRCYSCHGMGLSPKHSRLW